MSTQTAESKTPNGRAPRVARQAQTPTGSPLAQAILAVQAQAPKLTRNAIGQVGSRSYRYVSLDALLDVVLPLLVEQQLVWSTQPTTDESGQPALRYQLTHAPSGEQLEDVMPLLISSRDSQAVGSAITYARRYALTAVLNLAPDEDDDGAAASVPATGREPQASQTVCQPNAAAPKQSERPCSANQRKMLRGRAHDANLTATQLADVILAATGNEPRGMEEDAAERWLGRGLERMPASRVDAVLAGIAGLGEDEVPF